MAVVLVGWMVDCRQDLLVTISPDLTESEAVVNLTKAWVTAGSAALYRASKGWAKIGSVTILLPPSWTNISALPAQSQANHSDVH